MMLWYQSGDLSIGNEVGDADAVEVMQTGDTLLVPFFAVHGTCAHSFPLHGP